VIDYPYARIGFALPATPGHCTRDVHRVHPPDKNIDIKVQQYKTEPDKNSDSWSPRHNSREQDGSNLIIVQAYRTLGSTY